MSALQGHSDGDPPQSGRISNTTHPTRSAENGMRKAEQCAHRSHSHNWPHQSCDSTEKDNASKLVLASKDSPKSNARCEDAPDDEEHDDAITLENSGCSIPSAVSQRSSSEYRFVSVGGSLIPPINFGIVEEDLYRSGMPNELNFPFLERLQLRTIIYLASDEVSDKLHDFIDDQDIQLLHLFQDDDIPTPWKPISEETVLSVMELLLSTPTYPVYIMCSQGRHRTGTVVGCLRKLQRWSLSSIFDEYHRHADGKGRLVNEQFIELFDTDLINLPSINRPKWIR
ncbi:unnamed protein product [Agarophyton chilense]